MRFLEPEIDSTKLKNIIETAYYSPSFNEHARLMMSDATFNAMSHKHFLTTETRYIKA